MGKIQLSTSRHYTTTEIIQGLYEYSLMTNEFNFMHVPSSTCVSICFFIISNSVG